MSVLNLSMLQTEKAALFYKLCAGIVNLHELGDDQLLRVATFTKLYKNNKTQEVRWSADWIAMGLKLSKTEHKQLWHRIAEHVMQAPVDVKKLPGKSIKIDYSVFAEPTADMLEFVKDDESVAQNVYNIYEGTGKVVHALQLEDFISGKVPEKPSDQVIKLMKSLKLAPSELTAVQRYINNSMKARATKFRVADMILPEHLQLVLASLRAKGTPLTNAATLNTNWGQVLAKLGMQGYRLAVIEPVFHNDDVSYYKHIELLDMSEYNELVKLPDSITLGLEYKGVPTSDRPVKTFMNIDEKHKLTVKAYLEGLMEQYKANRDVIQQYLQKPKRFYIKCGDKYEWNHLAIALDILHNENIYVHPDTFYLTTSMFDNKEPLEWLSEI